MRHQPLITWTILAAAALLLTAPAAADDKDFLREVSAAPNLIFILDTSSSMVLSPEVTLTGDPPAPGRVNGALVTGANVPGGGDDPYSRMGIAKRVLRDFLEDVGEANIALAGYAQAPPGRDPANQSVPFKHWVYEARAQDRFHMVEPTYAYRLGYSENHAGQLIDNPSDILAQKMIGYRITADPASTPVTGRFGPTTAFDTGYVDTDAEGNTYPAPYDLMPIYFGNAFPHTPANALDDGHFWFNEGTLPLSEQYMSFPFYDSGVRESGIPVPERWYYGDPATRTFPDCNPTTTPTADNPDDGCLAEWNEISGVNINQWKRRVQLRMPEDWSGSPNHFLAVDGAGNRVGNTQEADTPGNDNYPGVSGDIDGDESSDWMLYVLSREETSYRECTPPETLPTWTPTPTKTYEEYCKISVTGMNVTQYPTYGMQAVVRNDSGYIIEIVRTYWDWGAAQNAADYVNWMCFGVSSSQLTNVFSTNSLAACTTGTPGNIYWRDTTGTSSPPTGKYARPLEVSKTACDPADTGCLPWVNSANPGKRATMGNAQSRAWWGRLYENATNWNGIYEVCFDFAVLDPTDSSQELIRCTDICGVTAAGSAATPTNTPVPVTPTNTWTPGGPTATATPTWFFATATPTRTPTIGILPTSTPTPTWTATPRPPTPTRTATPTNTPPV